MKFQSILIVEDNPIDAYVTKHLLEKADIADKVVHVVNGHEGILYIEQKKNPFPDVILLDIRMPVMDGFCFLDRLGISPHPQRKNRCIFMLTSSNCDEDITRAKTYANVVDYLHKPFKQEYIDLLLNFEK